MKKLFEKLKLRWNIESNWQIVVILVVFSCTGFSAVFAKKFVFEMLGITSDMPFWFRALVWLLTILPIYNFLLIIYGTIFGQRRFFWWFLKKSFSRFIPKKQEKVTS
ncbi:MAG: prolipoprotein diacylglyceryl transferase [Balneola sp.]|nr:MAG: prolipoprotein diacylglyceryl transferase [Balneola sp.]